MFSALSRYEADKSDPFTGSTDAMSAGNGGLMRLAPAILAASSRHQASEYASESTRLTHGCDEALFYSSLLANELWDKKPNEKLKHTKHPLDIDRLQVMSGGYVKETYQAAWWAFQTTNNFEDCIIAAINRGHDTDTTGAVAGMIAGAIHGYSSIPSWMLEGLQWHDEIKHIAERLITMAERERETPREELSRMSSQIARKVRNPVTGKIYKVDGKQCLCINRHASYGGGAAALWAVEGQSAQLTLNNPSTGYMRGKCIRVSEGEIEFRVSEAALDWFEDGLRDRRISVEKIGRYDTNWHSN